MPKSPEELFAFLEGLGIAVTTRTHAPLFTVADSQELRGEIPGAHTKNLFLKDKKDSYFLLTVEEEASVDLKSVHQLIGAAEPRLLRQAGSADGAARRHARRGHHLRRDQRYGRPREMVIDAALAGAR